MKKTVIGIIIVLILMEGVSWMAFKSSEEPVSVISKPVDQEVKVESKSQEESKAEPTLVPDFSSSPLPGATRGDGGSFPPPSMELVNGRTERTIHMGVRQYVWEPSVITAKKGELVRLIVHNADVTHGLVIPDLGVNQDIPPDGAVVEFVASRVGTFEFFCSVWCGEGHMEMRGKLRVE